MKSYQFPSLSMNDSTGMGNKLPIYLLRENDSIEGSGHSANLPFLQIYSLLTTNIGTIKENQFNISQKPGHGVTTAPARKRLRLTTVLKWQSYPVQGYLWDKHEQHRFNCYANNLIQCNFLLKFHLAGRG